MVSFESAEFVGSGCEVSLDARDWAGPTNMLVRPDRNHIHLNLPPIAYEGRVCFPEVDGGTRHRIGKSFFRPAGYLMESWGTGGLSRRLRCSFTEDWANRALGAEAPWTPEQVERSCDLEPSAVMPLLVRMTHEIRHPGMGHAILIEALINQAVVELTRFLGQMVEDTPERGVLHPALMRQIEDRTRCEERQPPTVAELADLSAMSERHLLRLFRTTAGVSVSDYVRRELVARARRLLEEGELPIKQIAHCLGFAAPSSFSLAFRRSTGSTPAHYRSANARRKML
jgi:AraC family transcriptional regulator